ncbi:MAG TPA: hypothetical protein VN684_07610 [Terriglobales bacterium]|nr:hypothetical protein [Terriglobales bacterium]
MPSINFRIERAVRLVRMLDNDAPLMAVRIAPLTAEHQKSALSYADMLRAKARMELEALLSERNSKETADAVHPAAD